MPYRASQVAYAFVKRGIAEGNYVTQMKLQKMVFFAHGYHLAKYDAPLIEEFFEAWRFGPVVPSIYHDYKIYGSSPITDSLFLAGLAPNYLREVTFDDQAKDAINFTWEATKNVTALTLSNWTHMAGTPWTEAYKPEIRAIPISNEAIKSYFKKLLSKV